MNAPMRPEWFEPSLGKIVKDEIRDGKRVVTVEYDCEHPPAAINIEIETKEEASA